MRFSVASLTTALSLIISIATCSVLVTNAARAGHIEVRSSLSTRANDSSNSLEGDYSFLSFHPTTEGDLWNAMKQIKPETFIQLFGNSFQVLQDIFSAQSVPGLHKFLNNVYANNLGNEDNLSNTTSTELGAPPDPEVIRKSPYRLRLYNYVQQAERIDPLEVSRFTFALFAKVTQEWSASGLRPDAHYPNPTFRCDMVLDRYTLDWQITAEHDNMLYEDIAASIQMFGIWGGKWLREPSVPAAKFEMWNRTQGSGFVRLGTGTFSIILDASTSTGNAAVSR